MKLIRLLQSLSKSDHPQFFVILPDLGRELLMCFQDVASPSARANSSATFLIYCVSGTSLATTTCFIAVVGVSKGMLHVINFHSNKSVYVSVKFHEDHKTITKLR